MGVVGFDEVLYIHETKQKGRNTMWYDTNKLKVVNDIKVIITKRTRKGRNKMNSYTFIGTEKDLLDNGFVYRPHFDNFCSIYSEENWKTSQNLVIVIDSKTKEVNIYIHTLNGHKNKTYLEEGRYNMQADIYPIYFKIINELIEKNIIKEKENEKLYEKL